MARPSESLLWLLARTMHGGIARAALATGVSVGTMYNAARGHGVSDDTRAKLETAFPGYTFETLQQPVSELIGGAP